MGHVTYSCGAGCGSITAWNFVGGDNLGQTNYLAVAGGMGRINDSGWDAWEGLFYNRSTNSMADVLDGTSNCLMFGEFAGGHDANNTRQYAAAWIGAGGLPTAWGLKPQPLTDTNRTKPNWYQFGSYHPGTVLFAMADGAVRQVSVDVTDQPNQRYFRMLSAVRDGNAVPSDVAR